MEVDFTNLNSSTGILGDLEGATNGVDTDSAVESVGGVDADGTTPACEDFGIDSKLFVASEDVAVDPVFDPNLLSVEADELVVFEESGTDRSGLDLDFSDSQAFEAFDFALLVLNCSSPSL